MGCQGRGSRRQREWVFFGRVLSREVIRKPRSEECKGAAVWRVKGRAFPAEGTEWTKDLGRTELGGRLDAAVPVPGGGEHLSLHVASYVG